MSNMLCKGQRVRVSSELLLLQWLDKTEELFEDPDNHVIDALFQLLQCTNGGDCSLSWGRLGLRVGCTGVVESAQLSAMLHVTEY